MNEETLTILAHEPKCWYSLQYEDFDNDLLKGKCWKEIVREIRAKCKEKAAQYYFHYTKAY
jgi:hypothetical protein